MSWLVAGGFSHQYWCVCDFLGLPYREEVQWVGAVDRNHLFSFCFFLLFLFSVVFLYFVPFPVLILLHLFFCLFLQPLLLLPLPMLPFLWFNIGFIVWTSVVSSCDVFSSFCHPQLHVFSSVSSTTFY